MSYGTTMVSLFQFSILTLPSSLTSPSYLLDLAHAALIQILLPSMLSHTSSTSSSPRIILISSEALQMSPGPTGILYPLLKSPMDSFTYLAPGLKRYGQSKLAMRLYGTELSKHVPEITTIVIHPGEVKTEIVGTSPWWAKLAFAINSSALTPDQGCWNTLWAVTAHEVLTLRGKSGVQGQYFVPVGKIAPEIKQDWMKGSGELWDWTQKELVENGFEGLKV